MPTACLGSPCFREDVNVTYKTVSFLSSLDNFLSEKCNRFLLSKSNFKIVLIWKKGYFWPTFHIFQSSGKDTNIPSAHIRLTYIYVFCSLYGQLLPSQFFFFFLVFVFVWTKKGDLGIKQIVVFDRQNNRIHNFVTYCHKKMSSTQL